jgi:hypothetical protein
MMAIVFSLSRFQRQTSAPLHRVTVTLTASDIMVEQNSVVPFALVPKTEKQRVKIVTMILGPPPGTRDDLASLRKEISESSTSPSPSPLPSVFTNSCSPMTTTTDNPLMKKIESVFAIQSMLSGFLEVMDENMGMSLDDLVNKVTKIKSLYTIAAILKVPHSSFCRVYRFSAHVLNHVTLCNSIRINP